MRPQETVTPLVHKLGSKVTINFNFYKGDEENMVSSALANNGEVLICWEHHKIPTIASQIPINKNNKSSVPSQWPDDRFDLIWVFDLNSASNTYSFNQVPQNLLDGDSPTLIDLLG